jgi:hypothetical protein
VVVGNQRFGRRTASFFRVKCVVKEKTLGKDNVTVETYASLLEY